MDEEEAVARRPEEEVEAAAGEPEGLARRQRQLEVVGGGDGAADTVHAALLRLVLASDNHAVLTGRAGGRSMSAKTDFYQSISIRLISYSFTTQKYF